MYFRDKLTNSQALGHLEVSIIKVSTFRSVYNLAQSHDPATHA